MKSLGVLAGVEGEEACVDAALAKRRQEREQMLLRAADALNLGCVQHPHLATISA